MTQVAGTELESVGERCRGGQPLRLVDVLFEAIEADAAEAGETLHQGAQVPPVAATQVDDGAVAPVELGERADVLQHFAGEDRRVVVLEHGAEQREDRLPLRENLLPRALAGGGMEGRPLGHVGAEHGADRHREERLGAGAGERSAGWRKQEAGWRRASFRAGRRRSLFVHVPEGQRGIAERGAVAPVGARAARQLVGRQRSLDEGVEQSPGHSHERDRERRGALCLFHDGLLDGGVDAHGVLLGRGLLPSATAGHAPPERARDVNPFRAP